MGSLSFDKVLDPENLNEDSMIYEVKEKVAQVLTF